MELLGILLPILIDLINRRVANSDLRFWISAGICIVVGIFLNWLHTAFAFATPLDAFNSITTSAMAVFGLAQLSYKGIYENSALRVKAFGLSILSNQGEVEKK